MTTNGLKRFAPAFEGWTPEPVLRIHMERIKREGVGILPRAGTYKRHSDIDPMPAPVTAEQVRQLMNESRREVGTFLDGHRFPVPIYGRRSTPIKPEMAPHPTEGGRQDS